jgi:hypothetical protein
MPSSSGHGRQKRVELETRHYFDVVADLLRDDIKRIADAELATAEKVTANGRKLDAINGRLDGLAQRVDSGFADMRREFANVKRDVADVKRDIAALVKVSERGARRRRG